MPILIPHRKRTTGTESQQTAEEGRGNRLEKSTEFTAKLCTGNVSRIADDRRPPRNRARYSVQRVEKRSWVLTSCRALRGRPPYGAVITEGVPAMTSDGHFFPSFDCSCRPGVEGGGWAYGGGTEHVYGERPRRGGRERSGILMGWDRWSVSHDLSVCASNGFLDARRRLAGKYELHGRLPACQPTCSLHSPQQTRGSAIRFSPELFQAPGRLCHVTSYDGPWCVSWFSARSLGLLGDTSRGATRRPSEDDEDNPPPASRRGCFCALIGEIGTRAGAEREVFASIGLDPVNRRYILCNVCNRE